MLPPAGLCCFGGTAPRWKVRALPVFRHSAECRRDGPASSGRALSSGRRAGTGQRLLAVDRAAGIVAVAHNSAACHQPEGGITLHAALRERDACMGQLAYSVPGQRLTYSMGFPDGATALDLCFLGVLHL